MEKINFEIIKPTLEQWAAIVFPSNEKSETALEFLTSYTKYGEERLLKLPNKNKRNINEQLVADTIHASCRECRIWFMKNHAIWIYNMLTKNKITYLRLNELVYAAAELCPGLVPTKQQIIRECQYSQSHKEGREIDQGIFFWGLLHVPEIRLHLIDAMLRPTVRAKELIAKFHHDGYLILDKIKIERHNFAAYITIQNQDYLNSEDNDLTDDMETATDIAILSENIKIGILRGGVMTHPKYQDKRVFSSGINLKHLDQGKISFVEFILSREFGFINKIKHGISSELIHRSLTPSTFSKPWLAVVDSFAIGGGAQLLLVFDKVIAVKDSYFSLPAANEGIIPGVADFRLMKLVGGRLARQIILSGRKIWTHDQESKLLFDEIVEQTEVNAAIEKSIIELRSPAVRVNKYMINTSEESKDDFGAYMAEFSLEQSQRLYSQDVLSKISQKYR